MCPKLIELLSWNGPTVHVCCFMLARASTKTFVSRIHIRFSSPKNSEKNLRQPKKSLAGSLVSRGITIYRSLQRHVSALYMGHHQVVVELTAQAILACVWWSWGVKGEGSRSHYVTGYRGPGVSGWKWFFYSHRRDYFLCQRVYYSISV